MTNHPQEASKHLGAILSGICQLALDVEKDVRRECFKALDLVFATQTPSLVSPFFNLITSYLRCAMTHINTQIQEDSLFMLDCLLMHVPSLVAANSNSIFSCFLDMISKLRIESKPERTLTMNLGSKMTSVKWRSNVLDRLLGILKAIVESKRNRDLTEITNSETINPNAAVADAFKLPKAEDIGNDVSQQINQTFNADAKFNYAIIRRSLHRNCDLPFLFHKTVGTTSTTAVNLMSERNEGQKIEKYTELLMPLLFETWMEVRPANLNNMQSNEVDDKDVCISHEAAHTLKTTIQIIEQLIELMQMWDEEVNHDDLSKWFRQKYGSEFSTLFLFGYPYLQSDGFRGKYSPHRSSSYC